MSIRELINWNNPLSIPVLRRGGAESSLFALQNEMNRLFDDYFGGYGSYAPPAFALFPAIDLLEEEKTYEMRAEIPGLSPKHIEVSVADGYLTIKGEKKTAEKSEGGDVLYRGIASRAFERRFQLADYVEVKGASLENGLLHVDLVREIPEAAKPRTIKIANGNSQKQVEAKVAA